MGRTSTMTTSTATEIDEVFLQEADTDRGVAHPEMPLEVHDGGRVRQPASCSLGYRSSRTSAGCNETSKPPRSRTRQARVRRSDHAARRNRRAEHRSPGVVDHFVTALSEPLRIAHGVISGDHTEPSELRGIRVALQREVNTLQAGSGRHTRALSAVDGLGVLLSAGPSVVTVVMPDAAETE
jgi:hypothetical protein